jgi:hypothetical protein
MESWHTTRAATPQNRYPPELRERAVRMVLETIEQTGERLEHALLPLGVALPPGAHQFAVVDELDDAACEAGLDDLGGGW